MRFSRGEEKQPHAHSRDVVWSKVSDGMSASVRPLKITVACEIEKNDSDYGR